MSNLEQFTSLLGENWAVVLAVVVAGAIILEKLAQSSDSVAKLIGPVGRWARRNFAERNVKHIHDVEDELARLAVEIVSKTTPADYAVVKTQLENVMERLDSLERENKAMRAFIVYDERWHWYDSLHDVGDGSEWVDFLAFRRGYDAGNPPYAPERRESDQGHEPERRRSDES